MKTREEDTAEVIATASKFVAVAFRGRAQFERLETASLEKAREAAALLHTNRPVGIYAIAGAREVHVENWEPKKNLGGQSCD